MEYLKEYSEDDLFEMFANQADFNELAAQSENEIVKQLQELAPDMEDAYGVMEIIRRKARKFAKW